MREEMVVDEQHLNDISENVGLGRSIEILYGRARGSRVCSLRMPNRWQRKGSCVRCISMKRMPEIMLEDISKALEKGEVEAYSASKL